MGEYNHVNVRASILELESLFLVKVFCLYKKHADFPSSFEITPPLWLLRYYLPYWDFKISRLGNVCPYKTVCLWYAADLRSESSLWSTGFSLHDVENQFINLKFPSLEGELYNAIWYDMI